MANAIIMASGLGTRMRPLTETTPKPLIDVCGKPMIESVIDALNMAETERIFVVVGYLKEKFAYLCEKYKNVELIENPDYETVNNISSVFYASEVLDKGDVYICEADLFVANKKILCVGLNRSSYFGKLVQGYSDDWVFETDKSGRITRVGKGGTDLYNMVGIAYLTANDAKVLRDKIVSAYGKSGYEILFWDNVVDANLSALDMRVQPVADGDIYEIDTVDELEKFNKTRE